MPQTEEEDLDCMSAWDDVSGKELKPEGVRKARELEIKHVNMKKVWRKMSRAEATKQGCKFIGTRWVDVDKGDERTPTIEADWSPKNSIQDKRTVCTPLRLHWKLSDGY